MKKLWLLFPALLLTAGLIFMGCDNGGGGGGDPDIDWELTNDGTTDADGLGTKTTENLIITFKKAVELGTASAVVTVDPAAIRSGAVAKISDTVYHVPVTVTSPGEVKVTITQKGIVAGPKTTHTILVGVKEGDPDWMAGQGVKISDIVKFGEDIEFENVQDSAELGKYLTKPALKLEMITYDDGSGEKDVNRVVINFGEPVDLAGFDGLIYNFGLTEIEDADLNGCSISTELINTTDDTIVKLGYWANSTTHTYAFATAVQDGSDSIVGFTFDQMVIQVDAWQEKPSTKKDSGIYLYSVSLREEYVSENEFVVYDIEEGLADDVTVTGATVTPGTGIVVTPGSGQTWENKPTATLGNFVFTFSPSINLDEYQQLRIEWEGLHPQFKQGNFNLKFTDSEGNVRNAQTQSFNSDLIIYEIGTGLVDWDGSDVWGDDDDDDLFDTTAIVSIQFFSDFLQADVGAGWAEIAPNDSALEDFVIVSFKFE